VGRNGSAHPKIVHKKEKLMKKGMTMFCMLAAAAGILVFTATQAKADKKQARLGSLPFSLDGFQANDTAPLNVLADGLVGGATWSHVYGPVGGSSLGTVLPNNQAPQAVGFSGAGCQLEYSQDQFSANGGRDTFNADVYSTTCQPFSQPGAAMKNGSFSIVSGTGLFQNLVGGGGTIQISARADGSVIMHLAGNLIASGDSYRQF
jgi:hypothetical protein